MKHHIIISGTGRAGTTFLVQLLTALGYDTGFTESEIIIEPGYRAGLEKDIRKPDAPYIIKTPFLCHYLNQVMSSNQRVIDHAFVPMRDFGR